MKKVLRKLYRRELLHDFLMFGLLLLIWGCFLLFQITRIANGTIVFSAGMDMVGFSVVVLITIVILAVITLYKKSMSYVLWYKGILDSIPIPVIITDKNAELQHINAAARKILNLKQDANLEELNCLHLIGDDGGVLKKYWKRGGAEYRITGNHLYCSGKDVGYLILLNNVNEVLDSCETRTELINEINRLFSRMGAASNHFRDCADTLAGCTTRQADIISELSEVIAGIASGALNEPEVLNQKMHTVNVDIRRHLESNRAQLEKMKQSVEEFNSINSTIGGVLNDIDSIS